MARPKKDSNLATVSYNLQNVERSIGYTTALINHGKEYRDILKTVIELYKLSPIEAAIVQISTVDLIAPQFKVIVQNTEEITPSNNLPELKAEKIAKAK